MKTENLTFLEAVRALKEGRCDGIQPHSFESCSYCIGFGGTICFEKNGAINTGPDTFLGPWRLINPRPITEPVEEKRWMWNDGAVSRANYEPHMNEPGQWVTVRYEREVPEPKTKEFESDVELYGSMAIILAPADYIGKRVRCIVED